MEVLQKDILARTMTRGLNSFNSAEIYIRFFFGNSLSGTTKSGIDG